MIKFGYPASLVRAYDEWTVLARPHQCTLGALILVNCNEITAFSEVSAQGFDELARVTDDIERGLAAFRPYQRINYLMLMMKDPHVHFHVVPRYARDQRFENMDVGDPGWPGVPDLGAGPTPDAEQFTALLAALKAAWPG